MLGALVDFKEGALVDLMDPPVELFKEGALVDFMTGARVDFD